MVGQHKEFNVEVSYKRAFNHGKATFWQSLHLY